MSVCYAHALDEVKPGPDERTCPPEPDTQGLLSCVHQRQEAGTRGVTELERTPFLIPGTRLA
jgi:hypothetical protein